MRVVALALMSVCFIFLAGSVACAQSAREMLQACEMLQRGMHIEGNTIYIPPSTKVNQCWGFVEAVQEYSSLADQYGKTLLDACMGENSTTIDVLHAFVAYLQKHPEKLDLKAAAAAYNAMADAFPCK